MNRKLLSIALVLGLSAVLFSCKDDEKGPSSSFTFEDESYKLSKGYRSEFGEVSTGVYEHDISFFSKEVTASNIDSDFNFLEFTVFSSSETSLPDGTYTVESTDEALTIPFGTVAVGFNFSTFEGDMYDVTGGTIVISNSGKKFVFDLTLDGGETVTGTFNGALTEQQ